ncbi:hypothetical protein [Falsiroseomonas algicola]|uniref:hypothetical protein n=1 Tax=Falsiroseomonas algicola TaxID=2716930 RepID=UPI0013DF173C|nr:hypothetical protein [Falsiroseomonas algicola]
MRDANDHPDLAGAPHSIGCAGGAPFLGGPSRRRHIVQPDTAGINGMMEAPLPRDPHAGATAPWSIGRCPSGAAAGPAG